MRRAFSSSQAAVVRGGLPLQQLPGLGDLGLEGGDLALDVVNTGLPPGQGLPEGFGLALPLADGLLGGLAGLVGQGGGQRAQVGLQVIPAGGAGGQLLVQLHAAALQLRGPGALPGDQLVQGGLFLHPPPGLGQIVR